MHWRVATVERSMFVFHLDFEQSDSESISIMGLDYGSSAMPECLS